LAKEFKLSSSNWGAGALLKNLLPLEVILSSIIPIFQANAALMASTITTSRKSANPTATIGTIKSPAEKEKNVYK